MKKLLLSLLIVVTYSLCHAQDDVYGSVKKSNNPILDKEISITTDEFDKTTWVKHRAGINGSEYLIIAVYFQLVEGKPKNLRLKLNYNGKDWVFFDNVKFLINDEVKSLDVGKSKRNVYLGGVSETVDVSLTAQGKEVIEELIKVGKGKIRFEGDSISDKNINKYDINNLRKVLTYYNKLGGI